VIDNALKKNTLRGWMVSRSEAIHLINQVLLLFTEVPHVEKPLAETPSANRFPTIDISAPVVL